MASREARSAVADTRDLLPQVERRASRIVALVAVAAVIVSLVTGAIIFRELMLLAIAVLFVIPFLMLVSAPVREVSSTEFRDKDWDKEATVRAQRGGPNSPR
jgi:hypothetical protein